MIGAHRRGGRVVECSGLENRRGFASSVGSNPTLSARRGLKAPQGALFLCPRLAERVVSFEPTGSTSRPPAGEGRRQRRRGAAPSEASQSHPLGARKARPSLSANTKFLDVRSQDLLTRVVSQVLSTPIHDAKPHGRSRPPMPACCSDFRNLIPQTKKESPCSVS